MDFTGFILTLVATVGFGVNAVFVAKTSRTIGPVPSLFLFEALGLPLFFLLMPFMPQTPIELNLLPIALVGVAFSFNYLLFLHAAKIGQMAVVGPIGQLYSVVTAILGVVVLHESFGQNKFIGMLLIVIGVLLLGFVIPKKKLTSITMLTGVPHVLVSTTLTGFYLYAVALSSRANGWFFTALTLRLAITMTTLCLMLLQKYNFSSLRTTTPWKFITAAAIFDILAFSLYNHIITSYEISTVNMIASLQAAVIVIFSWIVFKKRLNKQQIIGLVVALLGLVSLQLL